MRTFLGALVIYGLFVACEHGLGFTWGQAAFHSSLFGLIGWFVLANLPGPNARVRKQAEVLRNIPWR